MIKKGLLGIVLGMMATAVMAVPAKRTVRTVVQSDGTKIDICLRGDESFHYFATADGEPLVETADGGYAYAKADGGRLVSTGVLAHNRQERGVSEATFLRFSSELNRAGVGALWRERMEGRNMHRLERAEKFRVQNRARRRKAPVAGSVANKKGLVILVNFSDSNMVFSQSEFNDQFNKEGYNKNRHIGSVRDYFQDQSHGQLTIDFDVVGPYKLSKKLTYYGENDSRGDDKYAGQMVAEACGMADSDVNFADYDWDGDGEVEQVYVIYAGYGEASGASKNTVWPHEWDLASSDYGKSMKLDGVTVNTYACSNELAGTSGRVLDGIGTACHEFSHCLGLPDLYDTDGNNFGMATWSLMDYGCYNGPSGYDGNVPCAYTAYEMFFSGWMEPTELARGCEVSGMAAITDRSEGYIIYNDKFRDEYYVLTNIQQKSWNRYAYGHGLLVTHVDYSEDAWYNNVVNNTKTRQRCTIIPADNATPALTSSAATWNSLSGDPFPGTSQTDSLTDTGKPAAILYNNNSEGKKVMGKPLTDIKEADGLISFVFNGGTPLDTPIATDATDVVDDGFTAHWEKVADATYYRLELRQQQVSDVELLMMEDFQRLKDSGASGSTDISGSLDSYTGIPGWTGTKLFPSSPTTAHGVKFGSASATGSLTTPSVVAPKSENVTVYLVVAPYGLNSDASITVKVGDQSESVTCNGGVAVTFSGVSSSFKVTIESTSESTRCFIDEIRLYDGALELDQIPEAGASGGTSVVWKGIETVDGLTENEYTFKGLEKGLYRYRVMATDGKRKSDWSDWIEVRPGLLKGDVNEDGKVDINDVVAIINQMAGTASWRYADVNEDEKVDINDVVAVINEMAL